MRRPWKRRGELSELDRRLRDERPRPSEELVRRIGDQSGRSRTGTPKLRLGLAASVSGVALAGIIALGGLGAPLDTAMRIVQFDNAGGSSQPDNRKPAKQQYEEKVTICHRPEGNPSKGTTLRLPRSAAEAHLRDHRFDTRGPCPRR
jgi:hypothetical protein